jgi:hypothetical protein
VQIDMNSGPRSFRLGSISHSHAVLPLVRLSAGPQIDLEIGTRTTWSRRHVLLALCLKLGQSIPVNSQIACAVFQLALPISLVKLPSLGSRISSRCIHKLANRHLLGTDSTLATVFLCFPCVASHVTFNIGHYCSQSHCSAGILQLCTSLALPS